jgi:hypothetical protein
VTLPLALVACAVALSTACSGDDPGAPRVGSSTESGAADSLLIQETDEVYWETCAFTLYLGRVLSDAERSRFDELLTAWYDRGVKAGYGPAEDGGGGFLHNMSDSTFKSDASGSIIEWTVDFGSVNTHAYTVLVETIEQFSRDYAVPLRKLVLGYHDDFSAGGE